MESERSEIIFDAMEMESLRGNRRKALVVWGSMLAVTCGALLIFGNIGDALEGGMGGTILSPLLAGLICAGLADAAFWFVLSLAPPSVIYEDHGERYHFALLAAVITYDMFVSAASGIGGYYQNMGGTGVLIAVTVAYFLWRFPSLAHMLRVQREIRRAGMKVGGLLP